MLAFALVLQAVREVSDADDEMGMQVSPGSPSIQDKQLKTASQPSKTDGNTSGSNESDGSKRRQGTTQGEGSNPTSVKDSNTATQTNGCSGESHEHLALSLAGCLLAFAAPTCQLYSALLLKGLTAARYRCLVPVADLLIFVAGRNLEGEPTCFQQCWLRH